MARKPASKKVYAVYNGKAVDMDYILARVPDPKKRFSFAGMRILDNAPSGYIVDGDKVYSVSRSYRMAKLIKDENESAPIIALATGTLPAGYVAPV